MIDLGLMGADGLSTSVGPYGGAANPLGPNDLNTIQSLVENQEYAFLLTSLFFFAYLSLQHL